MGSSSWEGSEKRTEAMSDTPMNLRRIPRKVLSLELSSVPALSERYAVGMDSGFSGVSEDGVVEGAGEAVADRWEDWSRDEDVFIVTVQRRRLQPVSD